MLEIEAIKERHSVRNYRPERIEPDTVQKINEKIAELNAEGNLHFQFNFGVDEAKTEMERLEREKNARDEFFRVSDEFTPNDRKIRKNTGKSRILQRFKRYDKNTIYMPRFNLQESSL